ncbi:MAG: PilZ domain-containing protein [Syntrophobacterales bacterium]|jgi:hypothetical protein
MIGSAQPQGIEIRVFVSHSGRATLKCPFCQKRHCAEVPSELHNKSVRAKCQCGNSFLVLFDSRRYYRKEVRLPGEYLDIFGDKDLMTVTTLSVSGAGFEAGRRKPFLSAGETIEVKFMINNHHNTWIKSKAVVRRVHDNRVGVEFVGMDEHELKCLGFYLMP